MIPKTFAIPLPLSVKENKVGKNIIACAKMIGITPAYLLSLVKTGVHHQTAGYQQFAWHSLQVFYEHLEPV